MLERLLTPGGPVAYLALAVAAAFVIAEVVARLARLALLHIQRAEVRDIRSTIVRRPIRIIRVAVFALLTAVFALPALSAGGARVGVGVEPDVLVAWAFGSGLRILLIGLVAYILIGVVAAVVSRLEDELSRDAGQVVEERLKRARTLGLLVRNVLDTAVLAIASLMALRELRVDITPILTGAGIVGLAVGFGAQTLVKDVISGFFMILENQVRVGDVARINGTGGLVEAIRLRTITLRDLEGIVHVFPNGSIDTLANLTKDFSYAVLNVGVAYKEDPDVVIAVLRDIGRELEADPTFGPKTLEPLEILGVDAFGSSEVTIKIRVKTLPLRQWDVGRELRRRIKKSFDARAIEIPFPHVTVYFGEASRPFQIQQLASAAQG